MLVSFAAIVSITSVVTALTGVSGMPADASEASAYVAAASDAAGSSFSGGPSHGMGDLSVFGSISRLRLADVPSFVTSHRAELDRMLTAPPRAADVSAAWKVLDPARRTELVHVAPHVVGNLEGVPYVVRGQANALDLKRTITSTTRQIATGHGKAVRIELKRKLTALDNVEKALTKHDGVTRTLVALDTSDDAKASIVVGDLATAKYVSVLVPGMYMSVGEQIVDWSRVAQDLHDQQAGWLKRLHGSRGSAAGTPGVAVVAWIGYQTPVLMNIGGTTLAKAGADSLERTLQGIVALRAGDEPYLSVLAHSYGSTAALLALERGTVTVDALALMGSPGSDAQSVTALSVRDGNVFVGQAQLDPIAHSAFFGSDPGSASYGAKRMGVGGGTDPLTGRSLGGSSGHNEYFAVGTECMRNLALIGIDRGDLVMGPGTGTARTASAR